jgi:ribosomal protein L37AE/L43A
LIDLARKRTAPKTIYPRSMYITDLAHFLDKSGAIGPVKGPALAMAQFQVDVVAHASDAAPDAFPAPRCFKCKKADVEAVQAPDDAVIWICPKCRTEGRISNWQGSMWDLRQRPSHPR